MSAIFYNKDSVFFVGGTGDKSGNWLAGGGCTKDFWDGSQELSDVMDNNGAPKSDPSTWGGSETACTVTIAAAHGNRLKITKANGFTNCQAGLVAYTSFLGFYGDARYEVYAKIDNSNIVLDEPYGGASPVFDTTCDINVGGAFDKLQNALDYTWANSGHNVDIHDNLFDADEEIITAPLGVDYVGGSVANNSHITVAAFHTQPGDMDKGGAYYQSPLDCLINGVDPTKCVGINANGGAFDIASIDDFDCVAFKHFYFHNNDKAAGHNCIAFANTPVGVSFVNCRFDAAYDTFIGTVYGLVLDGCYIGNDWGYSYIFGSSSTVTYPAVLKHCVFNIDGKSGLYFNRYLDVDGCLFWKGSYGPWCQYPAHFKNCDFYGQTWACIRVGNATRAVITGENNNFVPAEAADFVVYGSGALGAVSDVLLRKSCVWTVTGVPVTNHIAINYPTLPYRQLADVIEADPQFVDAAGGDFRLKLSSPAYRTGVETLGKL